MPAGPEKMRWKSDPRGRPGISDLAAAARRSPRRPGRGARRSRAVEVRQGADQPGGLPGRRARRPGEEHDRPRHERPWDERGVRGAPQQAVEPPPACRACAPSRTRTGRPRSTPPAVEEQEAGLAVRGRPVAGVEARHPRDGGGQQLFVARHGLLGRVPPVGEEREAQLVLGIGEVGTSRRAICSSISESRQQGRHGTSVRSGRHAALQLQPRQHLGPTLSMTRELINWMARSRPAMRPAGRAPGGSTAGPQRALEPERQGQDETGTRAMVPRIAGRGQGQEHPPQPAARRHAGLSPAQARRPPARPSVISTEPGSRSAVVAPAHQTRCTARRATSISERPEPPRQVFHRVPVEVARREIHLPVAGMRPPAPRPPGSRSRRTLPSPRPRSTACW